MIDAKERKRINRRDFIKVSSAASGGLMLSFSWLGCSSKPLTPISVEGQTRMNGYIKIGLDNIITIFSPNPEIGQNVKTSMPMIVADEMDADWANVRVEQAGLNTDVFAKQVAGGSQSIRMNWDVLRQAGATARQMLLNAAGDQLKVSVSSLEIKEGFVYSGNNDPLSFGELAKRASELDIPEDVVLKKQSEYTIIGKGIGNVDSKSIVTGQPLFGIDTQREGMVYACLLHSPGFGMKLLSFQEEPALKVAGVQQVVQINDAVAVIASSTWAAMQGKKALKAEWSAPVKGDDSSAHNNKMDAILVSEPKKVFLNKGDTEKIISNAAISLVRTYEAPFLPHNPLEPMNFFAHVTDEKVELHGPIQTPELSRKQVAKALGRGEDEIFLGLSRMGGGFGRRLRGDFVEEAALISDKIRKPVQLVYSREDDMTKGYYRPACKYKIRGSVEGGDLNAYEIKCAIANSNNGVRASNWPYGSVDHYVAASTKMNTRISTMAWRAPIANFLAFAEQTFIDELAELANQDPVEFRIRSLKKAAKEKNLTYEPERMIGVIKLAAEKSDWYKKTDGLHKGISVYYSHNSYVAEVAEVKIIDGKPKIIRIVAAVDCGIVINSSGAINQVEGGIIDGMGHAFYGDLNFNNGIPQSSNFNNYRMIRTKEVPKVDVHFVESNVSPTGLGEPSLPPASAAVANAIYKGLGVRLYSQPFSKQGISLA